MIPIYDAELLKACRVMFAPGSHCSVDFLKRLKPSALKKAFRKKAMETHPDRYMMIGVSESEMEERFKEVSLAYEILHPFVRGEKDILYKKTGFQRTRQRRPYKSRRRSFKRKRAADHFFKGVFPRHELLTGQYLYYSGLVSWRTLVHAIIWQRKQRPLYGQIASTWGILTSKDISRILRSRRFKEKFGECALRLGYITPFQHMAIMGRQRRLQRPIGEYFVKKGLITRKQMDQIIKKVLLWNIKVRHA